MVVVSGVITIVLNLSLSLFSTSWIDHRRMSNANVHVRESLKAARMRSASGKASRASRLRRPGRAPHSTLFLFSVQLFLPFPPSLYSFRAQSCVSERCGTWAATAVCLCSIPTGRTSLERVWESILAWPFALYSLYR